MGHLSRLLSRRLDRRAKTESPKLTAHRFALLETVVEQARACHRDATAEGTQDLAVLIGDVRVPSLKAWRNLHPEEEWRGMIARGQVPTVIHAMPRRVMAQHLGRGLPDLSSPAPEGRFWALVITQSGASLAAVDVAEPDGAAEASSR